MAYTRQGVVDEQGKEREILLQCQLEEGHTGEHEASETQQDEPGGKVTYRRRTWAWTPSAWASSRSIVAAAALDQEAVAWRRLVELGTRTPGRLLGRLAQASRAAAIAASRRTGGVGAGAARRAVHNV